MSRALVDGQLWRSPVRALEFQPKTRCHHNHRHRYMVSASHSPRTLAQRHGQKWTGYICIYMQIEPGNRTNLNPTISQAGLIRSMGRCRGGEQILETELKAGKTDCWFAWAAASQKNRKRLSFFSSFSPVKEIAVSCELQLHEGDCCFSVASVSQKRLLFSWSFRAHKRDCSFSVRFSFTKETAVFLWASASHRRLLFSWSLRAHKRDCCFS